MRVLLALEDRSFGDDVAALLDAGGHEVEACEPLDALPGPARAPSVVVVDGEATGLDLAVLGASWGRAPAPPVLMVLAATAQSRTAGERMGATVLAKPIAADRLAHEISRAVEVSAVTPMPTRPRARTATTATSAGALAALGLAGGGLPEDEAATILAGSRRVSLDIVREALRPLSPSYLTQRPLFDRLCARRALGDEEARFVLDAVDGARTLRTLIDGSPLGQERAARLLWGLVCGGAIAATPEPQEDAPQALARLAARLRRHLVARHGLMRGARPYEVLELEVGASREQVEHAAFALGLVYSPQRTGLVDLGPLEPLAGALWKQIIDARAFLADPEKRSEYEAFAPRPLPEELRQIELAQRDAEAAFARGQRALAGGDAFKAVSEMASAARRWSKEPDYDVWAAWARLEAESKRGGDRTAAARRERRAAEEVLAGRRPRPRSLLALAFLCDAAGDRELAVMHLQDTLALDPRQAMAKRALAEIEAGR